MRRVSIVSRISFVRPLEKKTSPSHRMELQFSARPRFVVFEKSFCRRFNGGATTLHIGGRESLRKQTHDVRSQRGRLELSHGGRLHREVYVENGKKTGMRAPPGFSSDPADFSSRHITSVRSHERRIHRGRRQRPLHRFECGACRVLASVHSELKMKPRSVISTSRLFACVKRVTGCSRPRASTCKASSKTFCLLRL